MAEETKDVPMTRDELRAALVGKKHAPERAKVTLFGCKVELQQPTLASILGARDNVSEKDRTTDVFIKYAYVPGTNELVFEEGDREVILNWPFTNELLDVQKAIMKLTGVDIRDAMQELEEDPLDESS